MKYTIEEEITAKLVSEKGLVGRDNASVIQQVKDENFITSVLFNDEASPGAMGIMWKLVEDVLRRRS